jgi:hypothetical protein
MSWQNAPKAAGPVACRFLSDFALFDDNICAMLSLCASPCGAWADLAKCPMAAGPAASHLHSCCARLDIQRMRRVVKLPGVPGLSWQIAPQAAGPAASLFNFLFASMCALIDNNICAMLSVLSAPWGAWADLAKRPQGSWASSLLISFSLPIVLCWTTTYAPCCPFLQLPGVPGLTWPSARKAAGPAACQLACNPTRAFGATTLA